jgi:hypothetical protein
MFVWCKSNQAVNKCQRDEKLNPASIFSQGLISPIIQGRLAVVVVPTFETATPSNIDGVVTRARVRALTCHELQLVAPEPTKNNCGF